MTGTAECRAMLLGVQTLKCGTLNVQTAAITQTTSGNLTCQKCLADSGTVRPQKQSAATLQATVYVPSRPPPPSTSGCPLESVARHLYQCMLTCAISITLCMAFLRNADGRSWKFSRLSTQAVQTTKCWQQFRLKEKTASASVRAP